MTAPINSIVKASEILKCLCEGTYRITDIARKLDYNQPTVYKVLKSLEMVGFANQDKLSRQYFPGPLIQQLAASPMKVHQYLIFSSSDDMEKLRDITNETVSLWVAKGSTRININMFESNQTIIHIPRLGGIAPIYAGAAGKILLSQLGVKYVEALLQKIELKPITSTTPTDKVSLLLELDEIRNQGYSWTAGEIYKGASAVAVNVEYSAYPVALMVAGLEDRMKENKELLISQIKECSASISNKLAQK